METCLVYFRAALTDPLSVPPWAEWWAANEELVQQVFSLVEYVRFKHRKLTGARQHLAKRGEEFPPLDPLLVPSCAGCGERTTRSGGIVSCPNCGVIGTDSTDPDLDPLPVTGGLA